jgi:hypothetical protein
MKLDIHCCHELNLASCANIFWQAKLYRKTGGYVLPLDGQLFLEASA